MIDLHCHLLPGIDDGPATMEDTLALARVATASGTRTIVATPHIDDTFRLHPRVTEPLAGEVRAALADAGIELEVLVSGEIALPRLADLTDDDLQRLHLGEGPYLLMECPLSPVVGDFDPILLNVQARGHSILLAHPERCPSFHRAPARLQRLVDAGMLCSVTAGSFAGQFGDTVRRFTLAMLREGLVHDIASDAHDARRRTPVLLEGLRSAESEVPGAGVLGPWLTEEMPAAILSGDRLPSPPPLPAAPDRRRWWQRRREPVFSELRRA